jgi:20S proteasome subunit alpha 5
MYLSRSEYDRDVNTFSRDGRLFQVEYAIEAIKLGSTAVGVKSGEGVVLAVEKRITSPLMETASIEKILEVDSHIACAMSGRKTVFFFFLFFFFPFFLNSCLQRSRC